MDISPSTPLTRKHTHDSQCNTIRSGLEPTIHSPTSSPGLTAVNRSLVIRGGRDTSQRAGLAGRGEGRGGSPPHSRTSHNGSSRPRGRYEIQRVTVHRVRRKRVSKLCLYPTGEDWRSFVLRDSSIILPTLKTSPHAIHKGRVTASFTAAATDCSPQATSAGIVRGTSALEGLEGLEGRPPSSPTNSASACSTMMVAPLFRQYRGEPSLLYKIGNFPSTFLLASHQGEPGSIPSRVTGFSHVGIVPDNAAGGLVFLVISRSPALPAPGIPALLHTYLVSPSSALNTSTLKEAKISSLFTSTVHSKESQLCTLVVFHVDEARLDDSFSESNPDRMDGGPLGDGDSGGSSAWSGTNMAASYPRSHHLYPGTRPCLGNHCPGCFHNSSCHGRLPTNLKLGLTLSPNSTRPLSLLNWKTAPLYAASVDSSGSAGEFWNYRTLLGSSRQFTGVANFSLSLFIGELQAESYELNIGQSDSGAKLDKSSGRHAAINYLILAVQSTIARPASRTIRCADAIFLPLVTFLAMSSSRTSSIAKIPATHPRQARRPVALLYH
ncbi:hypothetical protein PR048_017411 [Dryococelus australis]|uniref:Uncharacterized protein n=1 Tax=Dryococelus australis TaxID=614101 RepID=A0ABQ9H9F9_9NEOP|nr:hypothetical protein PR048_017411 [Dryococelus australis]